MGKRIPEEKRQEAVRMVLQGGLTNRQVAEQLGMSEGSVERYVSRHRDSNPEELTIPERDELKKLRKEVVELKLEREILKKAAAYFAKVHA